MNENQLYLSYLSEEDDAPFNFMDFIIYLLYRWKNILVFMIVLSLLGVTVSFYRAKDYSSVSEQLENARKALPENTAADLEDLHNRMLAYQEYQHFLEKNYATYVTNAANSGEYVIATVSYYLSTSIDHLDEILPSILLSEEEYSALREIVPDSTDLSSIYDRITVVSSGNITTGGDNTIVNITPEEGGYRASEYLFLVTLYGDSEDQCDQMIAIINDSFQKCVDSFKSLDSNISITSIEKKFSKNSRDYIQKQINKNMSVLNSIETQRTNLTNNRISKLTGKEKNYYDLLVQSETVGDNGETNVPSVSWKKWLAAGAFLGLILGSVFLFLCYLFDGKVKTIEEAEHVFRKNSIQEVRFINKNSFPNNLIRTLTHKTQTPLSKKIELVVADILLLIKINGYTNIFFICDENDLLALHTIKLIKEHSAELHLDDSLISYGNPDSSITELNNFSNSQAAVVLVELKNTKTPLLVRWKNLCDRYKIPTLGVISSEYI